jgi:hypothetical protein
MRRQQPPASHAQIGHSCAVHLVIGIKPLRMPNGGSGVDAGWP